MKFTLLEMDFFPSLFYLTIGWLCLFCNFSLFLYTWPNIIHTINCFKLENTCFNFLLYLQAIRYQKNQKKKLIYTNECNYNNIIGTNCSAPNVHFDNHCLFSDDRGHLCEKKETMAGKMWWNLYSSKLTYTQKYSRILW